MQAATTRVHDEKTPAEHEDGRNDEVNVQHGHDYDRDAGEHEYADENVHCVDLALGGTCIYMVHRLHVIFLWRAHLSLLKMRPPFHGNRVVSVCCVAKCQI